MTQEVESCEKYNMLLLKYDNLAQNCLVEEIPLLVFEDLRYCCNMLLVYEGLRYCCMCHLNHCLSHTHTHTHRDTST